MDIEQIEKLFALKERRTPSDNQSLYNQLQQLKFFKDYATKGKNDEINAIINKAKFKKYPKDHCLIELDIKNEYFYILLSGQVGFYIPKPKKSNNNNNNNTKEENRQYSKGEKQRDSQYLVKVFKKGESFGEISILYDRGSDGSMYSLEEDTCALIINKVDFMNIIGQTEKNSITSEIEFLQTHPLFLNWSFNLLRLLYFFSSRITYSKNEIVFLENSKPTHVYLVKKGEFAIYSNFSESQMNIVGQQKKNDDNDNNSEDELDQNQEDLNSNAIQDSLKIKLEKTKKYKLGVLGEGEIFGEEDILKKQKRSFSVICESYNGGGQLILIKRKVFKLSIMADIDSSKYIKERLKQKNYNHKLRLESIHTFLKDYKEFVTEGTNNNNNNHKNSSQLHSNETSNTTNINNNNDINIKGIDHQQNIKASKRSIFLGDQTQHQILLNNQQQGYLSPQSYSNNLNFNMQSTQNIQAMQQSQQINERKKSVQISQLSPSAQEGQDDYDITTQLTNHNDLLNHFSQFEAKVFKNQKNTISSHNQPSSSSLKNKITESNYYSLPQSKRGSIQSTDYSIQFNNLNQNNINSQQQQFQQKPINYFEGQFKQNGNNKNIKDFKISVNISNNEFNINNSSSQQIGGLKNNNVSQQQFLDLPNSLDLNKHSSRDSTDSLHSHYSTQGVINPPYLFDKKSIPIKRSSFLQIQDINSNNNIKVEKRLSNFYNQANFFQQGLEQSPQNDQNQLLYSNLIQNNLNLVLKQDNENQKIVNHQKFNNYFEQSQQQSKSDHEKNSIQQKQQQQQQNNMEVLNQNLNKNINKPHQKFILSDSYNFSPNKYPPSELNIIKTVSNYDLLQQQDQNQEFKNNTSNNIKMYHSHHQSVSTGLPQYFSMPTQSFQNPNSLKKQENLLSQISSNTKLTTSQRQLTKNSINQIHQFSQQNLDQFIPQQNEYDSHENKSKQNTNTNNSNNKTKKQFRNSIFTENFQKTFQQNLHQIQFRILQKKHKVKEIQQSIAKHFQDSTIKHFLEENALIKNKYESSKHNNSNNNNNNDNTNKLNNNRQSQFQSSAKSEPQLAAIKQILKNQLNYSPEQIEQGIILQQFQQNQSKSNTKTSQRPKTSQNLYIPKQKQLQQQQQNNSQQNQQQQYKFQQLHNLNLCVDIRSQQQDENNNEMKKFSFTPNDKSGTVHIKSLSSLNFIPQSSNSSTQAQSFQHFNFNHLKQNQSKELIDKQHNQTCSQLIQSQKQQKKDFFFQSNSIKNKDLSNFKTIHSHSKRNIVTNKSIGSHNKLTSSIHTLI